VAGASVHGRVKRSRGRSALAGAKAPGAHEPDAFDEAAGERGPRREGIGDDPLARQRCQRHRHRSRYGGQKPRPRRSGSPKVTSYDIHRKVPIQIPRPASTGLWNGDRPESHSARESRGHRGELERDRRGAIANAEARNTASTVPPPMKIGESNDPQGARKIGWFAEVDGTHPSHRRCSQG
jgi:hypothetical protein